ncbi:putative bifunctional diguanylate cyclase/phosphodiesterase [Novispirillum sp. DQ9]|uniref:putative bifunctional diguanylate cyclase/phosphodiesterase n=1 Tax=Novispirillum sp. DQ9 TaxID=3398612 RepID=UPI003C7B9C33
MMPTPADLSSAPILVVDDNPTNVALLRALLTADGYTNITSETVPERALELAAGKAFDLVLLDINMPGMDGFELMERLRDSVEAYLPVIVLTAQSDPETRMRALGAGARDFLSKPFDRLEVLHRIRNTLEARLFYRARREQAADLELQVAARVEDLARVARTDPITGLPNRRAVREELADQLCTGVGSLLFLAVRGITRVNDALGYTVGEQLLRACGERLKAVMPYGAVVGAWGGSQFVIVGPGVDASTLSHEVACAFAQPFEIEDSELLLDCSIGSCRFPADGSDPDRLVQRAALALFHGSRQEGIRHRPFSPGMEEEANHRLALERDLRTAVRDGQLLLHYQPKVLLNGGAAKGMEALLRWRHPVLGMVSPADFVPLAEETGAIVGIGQWVLHAACAEAAALHAEGHEGLRVAINVSGRQFDEPDLVRTFRDVLDSTGLPGAALEVEITETVLVNDIARARKVLTALRDLGATIAIDDFGTGYSSLAYLRQLPINTLKIDQSFVRTVTDSPDQQAIVRAIVALADSLGLAVVAEGVETAGHAAFLASLGCLYAQGYHFARPMPPDQFRGWLQDGGAMPRQS